MTDQPIEDGQDDPTKIDAAPTKAFFVDIITRDIPLDKSIQDLVDNCVDGAKRLRPNGNFEGLWVQIDFSRDEFSIKDNCGGIPLDVARKYAFKFGRAAGFRATPFSVGQFGVGMKRALFKMGDEFTVSSIEPASRFEVHVDVEDWAEDDTSWDFHLRNLVEAVQPADEIGTEIVVRRLTEGVAVQFANKAFEAALRNQIRVTQQHFMRAGLAVTFNGEAIAGMEWQLVNGEGIDPSFTRFEDDLGGEAPLRTRLYAGVGAVSSSAHAGWYVFCNGRCILAANQDSTTGWSEATDDGVTAPKYHGQFARFRGYAFLDCEDASILPWNTTKTDLDLDSDAYRRLRGRLIDAMRPVIDFLNLLDSEQDMETADRELSQAIGRAASVPIERLPERAAFTYRPPVKRGPALTSISYKKPEAEVAALKLAFKVTSNKDLGLRSFEYAHDSLVED